MHSHHPINHRVVARRLVTLGLGSALAALPLLCSTGHAFAAPTSSATPKALAPHVAGQVLVRFTSSTSASAQSKLLAQVGGKVSRRFSTGWMLVKVPSTEKALAALQSRKEVAAVQANLITNVSQESGGDTQSGGLGRITAAKTAADASTPNDPYYPQQWALQKINAPEAWKTTTGSDDVIVAVVGVGIQVTHKDLAANIWTNTKEIPGNGKDDDGNGYIDDIHGWNGASNTGDTSTGEYINSTRLAGLIGAVGNNGFGVTGLNWKIKMMTVATFTEKVPVYTSAGIIGALDYILGVRKKGTNVRAVYMQQDTNRIGPYAEGDSFKALSDAGVLIVAGAGEGGVNIDVSSSPLQKLKLTNMMIVGGSDPDDNRTATTGFGQKTLDIFAPGRNLLTTDFNSKSDTEIVNAYAGSGSASAYVTGAAALLWSTQPNLPASTVKSRIINSATRVEKLRPYVRDGRRLNVGALIANAVHSIRGTVTGPVEGSTGNVPLAGVSLYLDSNTTPSAITDSAGNYIISSVTGGKHTVKAVFSGFTFPAATTVNLPTAKTAPPTNRTVNITAKTQSSKLYSISGTTTQVGPGLSTPPVADVDIFVNDNPRPVTRTGKDGTYSITNLPAGGYFVRAVNSKTGEAAPEKRYVYLPALTDTGNDTVDFLFPVAADRTPPVLVGTNTPDKNSYTLADAPKTFEGTVTDESNVDFVAAVLSRYRIEADGTLTSQLYDSEAQKWVPAEGLLFYGLIFGKDQTNPKSFNWKFTFPEYDPGYVYGMEVAAIDVFGNYNPLGESSALYTEFAVTANTTANAASPGNSSSPSAKDS